MSKPLDLIKEEAVLFLVGDDEKKNRALYYEACDLIEGVYDLELCNILILDPTDSPDETGVMLRNFIIEDIIYGRVGTLAMNSPEDFLYFVNTPLREYIELRGPDNCPNVIFINGTKDISSYDLLHSHLCDIDEDYHNAIKQYEVLEEFAPKAFDEKKHTIIGILTYFSPECTDGISPAFESIPDNCNVIDAAYKYNPIPAYSLNIEKAFSENNLYVCKYINCCVSKRDIENSSGDMWFILCDSLFESEELEGYEIESLVLIKVDSINTPVRELIHSKNAVTINIKELISRHEVKTNEIGEKYSEELIKDIISMIKEL